MLVKGMLIGAGAAVAATLAVEACYAIWMATRGRAIFVALREAHAAGPAAARTWIDARYPAAAEVDRKNMRVLRERYSALALIGDFEALERELAALRGDPGWHACASAAGVIGIAIAADDPRPSVATLHAHLSVAERRKTAWFAPDRLVAPLVALGDGLIGAAVPSSWDLARISRTAPLLRAVLNGGLGRIEGAADRA